MEADLEPERLLQKEMDLVKRKVGSSDVYIERMRGYVIVEGKDEAITHELICNFNEISLRPMKTKEELGFILYGRNFQGNEEIVKEVLKCSRT